VCGGCVWVGGGCVCVGDWCVCLLATIGLRLRATTITESFRQLFFVNLVAVILAR